jgi:hypothetical protein
VSDISLRLRVRPHPVIHGGHQEYLRLCREQAGREEIVGEAVCRPSNKVCCRRRYDDYVCLAGEADVIERVSRSEDFSVHRTPGHCLERYRADELAGATGHHDVDFSTGLCKQTRQPH